MDATIRAENATFTLSLSGCKDNAGAGRGSGEEGQRGIHHSGSDCGHNHSRRRRTGHRGVGCNGYTHDRRGKAGDAYGCHDVEAPGGTAPGSVLFDSALYLSALHKWRPRHFHWNDRDLVRSSCRQSSRGQRRSVEAHCAWQPLECPSNPNRMLSSSPRHGFTLIEVMIALGVTLLVTSALYRTLVSIQRLSRGQ